MSVATSEASVALLAQQRPAPTDPLGAARLALERVEVLVDGVIILNPGGSSGRVLTLASQMLGETLYARIGDLAGTGREASITFLDEMYVALALVESAAALAARQEGPEFCAFAELARAQLDALTNEFDIGGMHHGVFDQHGEAARVQPAREGTDA